MSAYCHLCGVRPPHHWAGCPEDHESVGMPSQRDRRPALTVGSDR